ncbi:MAG: hypothetical protein JSR85_04065 [Proteobacteria bacterium]|nr:hypothetical protein [Pseudomonadota bacterium]
MLKIRSYETLGLFLIALLMAIGTVYSTKLISVLMPVFAVFLLWVQRGTSKLSFHVFPPFVFLFLLLVWGGLSIFWATNPQVALKTIFSLSMTFAFSFLFLSCALRATPELIEKVYRILKIAGYFLMILVLFQASVNTFHFDFLKAFESVPHMMKPTGSIIGLLIFAGCGFLWIHNEKFLCLLVFILLVLLIRLTICQTAFYGVVLATGMFVLSYAIPFWMTRLSMVGSYTFLIISPIVYAYSIPPARILESPHFAWLLNRSFYHRFLAWEFYAKKFFTQTFLGWGLDSSRYLPTDPLLAPGYENTLHPHNNSLQAFVELGFVGGVLYALFFASLFWVVEKYVKDRLSVAVCNATLVFGFIEAEVTHNLWRNYWLSLATLTAGLLIFFVKAREAQLHAAGGRSKQPPDHQKG